MKVVMKDTELDKKVQKIIKAGEKSRKVRASIKLKHPISFYYLERTKTGNKFEGADEINVELKAKKLETFGDVLSADKLETSIGLSYEKQILWELVHKLLLEKK